MQSQNIWLFIAKNRYFFNNDIADIEILYRYLFHLSIYFIFHYGSQ